MRQRFMSLAACLGLAAAAAGALASLAACVPAHASPGVSATLRARLSGVYTGANDLGQVAFSFDENNLVGIAPGTGAGQADKLFSDVRSIAASSSENLDLAGTLTDPFGVTLTCVKVKWLYFAADATNTNNVNVGGAASNGFVGPFADATDVVSIPPGGAWLITAPTAGWTVTAATGDLLKVANSSSGSAVGYRVLIGCTSA